MDLTHARLYTILDAGYVPEGSWARRYDQLIEGGSDIIQLRAKDATVQQRIALLDRLLPAYVRSGLPLIVNDNLDLAALYPGLGIGLHLGQDDLPPETARERLGPGVPIGLSTHSLVETRQALALAEAGVIDYFCTGPLFATPTKPDYPAVGLELARAVMELDFDTAWFCIGGINEMTLPQVTAAGIPRIVVVSAILQAGDPAAATASFKAALTA
ncbi:MAG: thiamine phosphate synthase [Opitutales bacterium]